MKIVDITSVTDLMAGLAARHQQTRPQAADNAARRARHYAGKVAAARAARRHLEGMKKGGEDRCECRVR